MRILTIASQEHSVDDFLQEVTRLLLDFTNCDLIGIYSTTGIIDGSGVEIGAPKFIYSYFETKRGRKETISSRRHATKVKQSLESIITGKFESSQDSVSGRGSFWVNDIQSGTVETDIANFTLVDVQKKSAEEFRSIALIPVQVSMERVGILQLTSKQASFFSPSDIEFYEEICDILGKGLMTCRAQNDLRERVKEITCLYNIAQIAAEPGLSLDDILVKIVKLLPRAWQYPEIAECRIILDGQEFTTDGFIESLQQQTADLIINGGRCGTVEVVYTEKMAELYEGPFLKEERNLIDTVANLIVQVIERKQAEDEKSRLQDQLRHADRLATIGQLAAGVAHEFNEPLGNILGFAQLILKDKNVPEQIRQDINKIITASMHAREVIKKLMLFARQAPSRKLKVSLNKVIDDGLYFLEARCLKAGIELNRELDPDLPDITVDQSQMHQIIVNLVVNAVQAMPGGGTITISTSRLGKEISLKVADTGIGMDEEVKKKLFIPFFTTKDIDEGTGLGLPVVHGIVTSHGGKISVESQVGKGSTFEIILPVDNPSISEVSE
ncbi:MAG: ATP-binding protein [bacterium]|nr:ATP-binding protein [bacterium]